MTKYFAALLMFFVAWPSFAADPNGYTAQYECRAGNPMCDVDITGIAALPCDQIVTASDTNWSKITDNASSRVFCIGPGNHTGKGTLTLTYNGTSSTRKVIRYYRSGDNDDNPWKQSAANQAKMPKISMNGVNYWIIHRLAFNGITSPAVDVGTSTATTNIILNRVAFMNLVPGNGVTGALQVKKTSNNIWMQNSVCLDFDYAFDKELSCLYEEDSHHLYFINNESRDIAGSNFQLQGGNSSSGRGSVVENNDMYITDARRSDGAGNQQNGGDYMLSKSGMSMKRGGTSAEPVRLIHNRMWGQRETDHSSPNGCCTSTGSGLAITWSNNGVDDPFNSQYILVQNNIIIDTAGGINVTRSGAAEQNSAIGNIFYLNKNYSGQGRGVFSNTTGKNDEYYLNTIIESDRYMLTNTATNDDFKCNVFINAGDKSGSLGSGSVFDYNVWYGSTPYSTETPAHNIGNFAVKTRQNNTNYSLGDVIRTSSIPETSCTAVNDSDCFLYKVTTAGTSAGSTPSYCTTLNCTTTDGTVAVKAIRGPYTFYRKLMTFPEVYIIPYAKPHSQAPEYGSCPANMLGSRTGVGVGFSIQ